MKVVIDNGSYHMDNMGDVAMLQVCVARVRRRWPEAEIRVVVETPDRLRRACPDAEPLKASAWHVLPMVPKTRRFRGDRLRRLERRAILHAPRLAYAGKRVSATARPNDVEPLRLFYAAVRDADAVICSGGGYINDWHAEHADKVIQTLAIAQGMGKPTAMFGIGLGPISDPGFRQYARPVLSRLDVLGLRERDTCFAELEAMRVPIDHATVTGDDAIALVDGHATMGPRRAIGVNVRVAAHSEVSPEAVRALAPVLREVAAQLDAPLVATPVRNRLSPLNDVDATHAMFDGKGVEFDAARAVEDPADLVRLVGRCRIVVTGAYHAAVFALSQGIPVVALSGSVYYDQKFGGLAKLFGAGVTILGYRDADLKERLREAIRSAWTFHQSSTLLEAARRQRATSEVAYDAFFDIVERRAHVHPRHPAVAERAAG